MLHVPVPCHESWAAMTPTGPGRHCTACQQTVVDFSKMSQADILAYLARAGSERVCGVFRPDQVQVPASLAPAGRWRRWAVAALTLLGLRVAAPATVQAQTGRTLGEAVAQYPARVLRGQVLAAGTGQPLAGVQVLVEGYRPTTITDAQGHFELHLSALPATARLSVVPASGQYSPVQLALPAPGVSAPLVVRLQPTALQVMGKPMLPRKGR